MAFRPHSTVEPPTLLLIALCYGLWFTVVLPVAELSALAAVPLLAFVIAFHSSLQHEVLHGHPLPSKGWSEALVFPAVGLFIPYRRFRDLHLQHHIDPNLTDPYEDPESNFLDPEVWTRLPGYLQAVFRFNNSLAGRMLVGPLISQFVFMRDDIRRIRAGERGVASAWALHAAGAVPVVAIVAWASPLSIWQYLVAAYAGLSILKIRTFLEHRAHKSPRGRTVVVEDRGLLALLFLNNNFHLVHHMNPYEPWYRLPAMFDQERERFVESNEGYVFRKYADVFSKYFFRVKDPVPHPIWRRK